MLRDALYKMNYDNPKINVSISETVLGRKELSEKSGMVFWAYDLGEQEIAKELLQFVWRIAAVQTSDEHIKFRLERAKKNVI